MLIFFLTYVSHEITNEDLQRTAIRARNVMTSWKNMMPQDCSLCWEGLRRARVPHILHSCHLLPLQVTLGANRKTQPFKTNADFQGRGSQEKMRTPCNVPNKIQRKVFSGTAGHWLVPHTPFLHLHISNLLQSHTKGGSSMSHD